MDTTTSLLIGFAAGALVALTAYILIRKQILKGRRDEILEKAELEGEKIKSERILQAKEKYLQLKSEHDRMVSERNAQLKDAENRIRQKESALGQKSNELEQKIRENDSARQSLKAREENLARKVSECEALQAQVNKQLEDVAGMSAQPPYPLRR